MLDTKRTSDRIMTLKLVAENTVLNTISVSAPRLDSRSRIYSGSIPLNELLILGGDLNGHAGRTDQIYK